MRKVGTLRAKLLLTAVVGASAALLPTPLSHPAASAAPATHSSVLVLYAASLEKIMNTQIGPAFDKATGSTFVGFPGPSKELANKVKGRLITADVFVSAAPAVNKLLMGTGNGSWVSSYKPFGRTLLELGYNPKSKFAGALRSKPWYQVVSERGFRLGRTDPTTDPKGELAVEALGSAARAHGLPALTKLATEKSNVFPETDLVGRVQLGDLDAGFFYSVEAVAARLPTVPLTGTRLFATYTVATVNRCPHPSAAAQFEAFLLGRLAQELLKADGLTAAIQG